MSNSSGGPNPPKGGSVPKPRGSNASLTDAVVAALAKVDDSKAAAKASEPVVAEAGCAATTQAPKGAPPPAIVAPMGAAPEPAAVPAQGSNGSNGAHGFRSGPGSFADLARRFAGGAALPVTPRGSQPPARGSAPSLEPPAAVSEPPAPAAPSSPPPASPQPSSTQADVAVEPPAAPISSAAGPVEVLYYGRTDVGLVREHNEDNFIIADLEAGVRNNTEPRHTEVPSNGLIFAVCDGMGGAAAGEVASQMAVDAIHEVMLEGGTPSDRDAFARRLVSAIEEAGHRIFSAAKMDRTRRGMGTTSTLAGLVDNVLFVGQVGDSRAYILRGDQLEMITKDQSLVNQLIEAGQLTEEEAEAFEHSNIILQALGTTEEVTVDLTFLEVRKGDRLLMCSDGLSGLVHADMIKEVLQTETALPDAAAKLIQMANAGGGHDNITVILADFGGDGLTGAADSSVVYQQYPLPPAEPLRGGSTPPRETSIKAGGPKPGADVKIGSSVSGAPPAEEESSGTSKAFIAILAVLLLVLVLGGGYLAMTMGQGAGGETPTPGPTTTVEDTPTEVEPDPIVEEPLPPVEEIPPEPAVVMGAVTVSTDADEGTLFVNDEQHGPLENGMTLELAPGTYTLRAMNGESRIAEATVVVEAEGTADVTLNNPEAPDEPRPQRPQRPRPDRPRPEVRPLGPTSPSVPPPRPVVRPPPQTNTPPPNPFG